PVRASADGDRAQRRGHGDRTGAADRHGRPARAHAAPRPRVQRALHRRAHPRAAAGHRRRQPGSAAARRALPPVRLPARPPMRIAFDVSPLSHPLAGIGNYLRGALAGLAEAAAGEHEIVAFAPTSPRGRRAIPRALDGVPVELRLRVLPFSHRFRMAWSRRGRPPVERFLGAIDVLHFSDWMYPPQAGGVRATTIHDLVPLRFPELVTPRTIEMHGEKYANAARTCDVVFANSAYTAADVVRLLGVPRERVRVAPPGVRPGLSPEGPPAQLGLSRPYALGLGTLEPRKNLRALVAAWELVRDRLDLVLAGGEGWGEQPELRRPGLHALGYVSDDQVAQLYRGAAVFVYPSRFEGFGMPVVEAMAC